MWAKKVNMLYSKQMLFSLYKVSKFFFFLDKTLSYCGLYSSAVYFLFLAMVMYTYQTTGLNGSP